MNLEDYVPPGWKQKPIVIITDSGSQDGALAIRAGLEHLSFRVFTFVCETRKNLYDVIGGGIPDCDYVILCHHGDENKIYFRVYPETWIGAADVTDVVHLEGKNIMTLGCGAGGKDVADSFLKAGCSSFIGSHRGTRRDEVLLLPLAFFSVLAFNQNLSLREVFDTAQKMLPQQDTFRMYDVVD